MHTNALTNHLPPQLLFAPRTPQAQVNPAELRFASRSPQAYAPAPTIDQPPPPQVKPEPPPTDLQALLDDWGQSDSPWDLNGDGTVGIQDLLMLLKDMGETPSDLIAVVPQTPKSSTEMPTDLQQLLDDWGKSDSPWDLNGDGTVGIQDLLMLLKEMGQDSRPSVSSGRTDARPLDEMAKKVTAGLFNIHDRDRDGLITTDDVGGHGRLLEALDQNGDGALSPKELMGFVRLSFDKALERQEDPRQIARNWFKMFGRNGEAQSVTGEASAPGHPAGPSTFAAPPVPAAPAQLRTAADRVSHYVLRQADVRTPGEVRNGIQNAPISAELKGMILNRLAALHQRGVHVSLVG